MTIMMVTMMMMTIDVVFVCTYFYIVIMHVPAGSLHVVGMLRFMSDINQPSLPAPFTLLLGLFLSLWPFQLYFIP